ncbi:hypothetical protein AAG570_009076 [Ranatra chinensis]|uniref:Ammonium transporter AmtB-like domain-containing protein n=1 Tax=Ranatra chinensis TaxID=642074 RepID=A0ABD0YT23_9HEMI
MIFIGFGFLMTFLKKYGFSSVGFNFLLAACMLEWGILCNGIFSNDYISVGINSLMDADVLAATILISMGAVLGKTTPFQLFAMGIIEAVIYSCNEELIKKLKVIDTGDSLTVHTFGAYFGLACSRVLGKPKYKDMEGSSYQSDIFAMIGTLFLWVFWPSFNGGSVYGDAQQRAVINTYISIAASCVAAFAISSITSRENKFNMVHVQNATLAGGVAVGTAASMVLRPYGAAIVGSVAGILSATGYVYLQPWLDSRLGIHDTCGVHNLHGMPGVLAGFVGAVGAGMASQDTYGQTGLFYLFPAMAPPLFSDEMKAIQMKTIKVLPGDGRSPGVQAGYQILGIVVTLVISVAAGALTGKKLI